MIVDVIVPRVEHALRALDLRRQLDNVPAEAAPEPRLSEPADAALVQLVVQPEGVADAVLRGEVRPKGLPAVAHLVADAAGQRRFEPFVALPDLVLEVLAVLVPLPVVLAAEALRALGAAVGLLVALDVFPSNESYVREPA